MTKYRPTPGCQCALCRQARQERRMPLSYWLVIVGILLVSWAAVRWL